MALILSQVVQNPLISASGLRHWSPTVWKMRPGLLDKPGALPLLIAVIFSLLTLAPSLSNIYNAKLADFTYNTYGARREYINHEDGVVDLRVSEMRANRELSYSDMPLIKEPVVECPSDTPPVTHPTSWTMTAQYRSRGNRLSRSVRSGNNPPVISGELASVDNKSRLSYGATESSFMFSRRARAFRTYFIQQLDDYQLFTPFSNRSLSTTETAHLNPTQPPSNASPLPTSLDKTSSENNLHLNNEPTPSSKEPTDWLRLQLSPLFGMWQQACRATIEFWNSGPESPVTASIESWKWNWESIEARPLRDQNNSDHTPNTPRPQDPQARTNATSSQPDQVPKSAGLSQDEATDAAVRTSPELKGSCMAVVIGLVVGIMWF